MSQELDGQMVRHCSWRGLMQLLVPNGCVRIREDPVDYLAEVPSVQSSIQLLGLLRRIQP